MKIRHKNQNGGPAGDGSCLDWLDNRWFCGTPDGRCRHCGLLDIFPPAPLDLEVCRCNNPISDRGTFAVEVRFRRMQTFKVKIIRHRDQLRTSNQEFHPAFCLTAPDDKTTGGRKHSN